MIPKTKYLIEPSQALRHLRHLRALAIPNFSNQRGVKSPVAISLPHSLCSILIFLFLLFLLHFLANIYDCFIELKICIKEFYSRLRTRLQIHPKKVKKTTKNTLNQSRSRPKTFVRLSVNKKNKWKRIF